MDKGYDSEKIHSLFRDKIRANSIIPVNKNKENENLGKIQKTVALNL